MSESEDALLRKAYQALSDARLLVEHDRLEAAVNRIYYAAFNAARAALMRKDETPNSHAGVMTRFSFHFVRLGKISREAGRVLPEAESMRNRADYDAFAAFREESVVDLLDDAEQFVRIIEEMLTGTD